MEKPGYRDQLEVLLEKFPGRATLTVPEVAEVLCVSALTVRNMIRRKQNPLPAQNMSTKKHAIYHIPITALARWQLGI